MRMRLTKAPWLLLMLLYIFPSLLHCPWCSPILWSATIPSSDSSMIDLEQGRDCLVNKVGRFTTWLCSVAVASSPLPGPPSPHELGSLPRLEDQSPYHAPQQQNKSPYKNIQHLLMWSASLLRPGVPLSRFRNLSALKSLISQAFNPHIIPKTVLAVSHNIPQFYFSS